MLCQLILVRIRTIKKIKAKSAFLFRSCPVLRRSKYSNVFKRPKPSLSAICSKLKNGYGC